MTYNKNIIRFSQSTPPEYSSDIKVGDLWFDTSTMPRTCYWTKNDEWSCIAIKGKYGYLFGGVGGSGTTYYSQIEKITFPFDSTSILLSTTLSGSRIFHTSGCNSSNYGWLIAGLIDNVSASVSIIEKIQFTFDSITSINQNNLTNAKNFNGSCNSSTYGYSIGGRIVTTPVTSIDRVDFSTNGVSSSIGNLGTSSYASACINSSNYAYLCNSSYGSSVIQRLSFPFNSGISTYQGNCGNNSYTNGGGTNSSQHGVVTAHSGTLSTVYRFSFPFDSGDGLLVGNVSDSRRNGAGFYSSPSYGFISYGSDGGTSYTTNTERFVYPFNAGVSIFCLSMVGTAKKGAAGIDTTDFNINFI